MVGRRRAGIWDVHLCYKGVDRGGRQCCGQHDSADCSKDPNPLAYDRGRRCDSTGIDDLGGFVFAFTLVVLLVLRDRLGALQLLAASAAAGILTLVTKNIIERIRPEEAQQLIVVSGFSYPSGHSLSTSALYLTIAIIASRFVEHPGARVAIFMAVAAVLVMVGVYRVYLGVHYATDVVSGISLGAAWALLLAGCFTFLSHRSSS